MRTVGVTAVIPCYNDAENLFKLLGDLGSCERRFGGLGPRINLRVIVIDNASDDPLPEDLSRERDGLAVRVERLGANAGGSGGFNRGISRALLEHPYDLVWLLDSDVRVDSLTLAGLVWRMEQHQDLVALGPALADPISRVVFEVGGLVDPATGRLGPKSTSADHKDILECDYLASCCALVRPDAIRATGLMPDVFWNGDDAEWFVRMGQKSGGVIAADPLQRAFHPKFDRFPEFGRYYQARNGFGVMEALALDSRARFRRTMRETARAVNQSLLGRHDLASLHLLGLRDIASGIARGRCPHPVGHHPARPFEECVDEARLGPIEAAEQRDELLEQTDGLGQLVGAARRATLGSWKRAACVPARGGPASWFRAKKTVLAWERAGRALGVVRTTRRIHQLSNALDSALIGFKWSRRIRKTAPDLLRLAKAPGVPRTAGQMQRPKTTKLSVVVLSRNRAEQLLWTVSELGVILGIDVATAIDEDEDKRLGRVRDHEIVVVLNAPDDNSAELLAERCPGVRTVHLDTNTGVDGFNHGAREARGEYVLILDDDAWPDVVGLEQALALLDRDPEVAAVALHPVHPDSKQSEWRFARTGGTTVRNWPVMGSGNLVRRRDWLAVGGYEARFKVYRNDMDLALKLLTIRRQVAFNARWIVWHNSPAAKRKGLGWHRIATRNWIWSARRHAGLLGGMNGILKGWLWAHKTAGFGPVRQLWTIVGAAQGMLRPPPALPRHIRPRGEHWRSLVEIKSGKAFR